MSRRVPGQWQLSRRGFLALPVGLLPAICGHSMATTNSSRGSRRTVLLYDAGDRAARDHARAASRRGVPVRAIAGDRVRFGRQWFARHAAESIVVVGRYADFLLLGEVAREAGYRCVGLPDNLERGVSAWAFATTGAHPAYEQQ